MIQFKEENGNLLYNISGVYKQLNNEQYLDATTLSRGLMTPEYVTKLNNSHNSDIVSYSIDNGHLTLTKRDGRHLIERLPIGVSKHYIVRPDDLVMSNHTNLIATMGKYRSNVDATYDQVVVQVFYDNPTQVNARYSNTTESVLRDPSGYTNVEASNKKFFAFHKFTLPTGQEFNSTNTTLLKVRWRHNHATVKYGILFKRGNTFYRYYDEVTHGNSVVNEDRYYDITGITGNQIIVYCQASAWWSFATEVKLYQDDLNLDKGRVGTWQEFSRSKDNYPNGSQFFITDTNNGKGVLAIKVGNTWKDTIGNNITSQTYRTVL